MSIKVTYYGTTKPGTPGAKPVKVLEAPERNPFNSRNPISWQDGKHLVRFGPEEASSSIPTLPENPPDPYVLGSDTEGTEAALTTSWTTGTEDGAKGLAEWYVSRVVYNHEGDKVLYAFLRKRTYDQYGRLYSVSAETRVNVDATAVETCAPLYPPGS